MDWERFVAFLRENAGWAVDLWLRLRGRALARNAGYLILAAIALESDILQLLVTGLFKLVGVQLPIPETPHYVAITFVVLAALLLLADRALPEQTALPEAYPHDEKLLKEIRQIYTTQLDDFLRTWAFGSGSFDSDILNPLDTFRSWKGAQYDFIDPKVNDAWQSVRQAARELLKEIAEKTIPDRFVIGRITPIRDDENPDWHTDEVTQRCIALDKAADRFAEEWDKFDAIARRLIPNVV